MATLGAAVLYVPLRWLLHRTRGGSLRQDAIRLEWAEMLRSVRRPLHWTSLIAPVLAAVPVVVASDSFDSYGALLLVGHVVLFVLQGTALLALAAWLLPFFDPFSSAALLAAIAVAVRQTEVGDLPSSAVFGMWALVATAGVARRWPPHHAFVAGCAVAAGARLAVALYRTGGL